MIDPAAEVWYWCSSCGRAYQRKSSRRVASMVFCAYADCPADIFFQGWLWKTYRMFNPAAPLVPEVDMPYEQMFGG